jgi:hypothetical protein
MAQLPTKKEQPARAFWTQQAELCGAQSMAVELDYRTAKTAGASRQAHLHAHFGS